MTVEGGSGSFSTINVWVAGTLEWGLEEGQAQGDSVLRTVNLCQCISQKEASLPARGANCAFTGPCWGLSVQKANCLLCQNTSGGLASFYAEHFSWGSLSIPKDRNIIR